MRQHLLFSTLARFLLLKKFLECIASSGEAVRMLKGGHTDNDSGDKGISYPQHLGIHLGTTGTTDGYRITAVDTDERLDSSS